MREEIAAAVVFLKRMIFKDDCIPKEKGEEFSNSLSALLVEKFRNHWYSELPAKGQAYRCIHIHPQKPLDPLVRGAAEKSGIERNLFHLPLEVTLWVDPQEVCCRVGDVYNHPCMVASFKDGSRDNHAHTINVDKLWDAALEQRRQRQLARNAANTEDMVIYPDVDEYMDGSANNNAGGGSLYFSPPSRGWTPLGNVVNGSNIPPSSLPPPPPPPPPQFLTHFSGAPSFPPPFFNPETSRAASNGGGRGGSSFSMPRSNWINDNSHWMSNENGGTRISPPLKNKNVRPGRGFHLRSGSGKFRPGSNGQFNRYHWSQESSMGSTSSGGSNGSSSDSCSSEPDLSQSSASSKSSP